MWPVARKFVRHPSALREIRKCKITGGLDAEALFVSKRRGDAVIRNI
jgi:hypothetical protein